MNDEQYPVDSFTYGCELEFSDCERDTALPYGCVWDRDDNTIVNSNGIANDPKGKLYKFGGEINTRPTETISDQVGVIRDVIDSLHPSPTVNFRSNYHVHVGVPGLKDDLESCKSLFRYIQQHSQLAFDIVEQIPSPPTKGTVPSEVYAGANKRKKRRRVSHQHIMPKKFEEEMLAATTTKEFFEGHAALDKNGRRAWAISPRAGINLRPLWQDTGTIEFRHFPGTIDPEEMRSCMLWCERFLCVALNYPHVSPMNIQHRDLTFPQFQPYDYRLDRGYLLTSRKYNSADDVTRRIEHFEETGEIIE